jgi:hypothetical protein
MAYYLSGTKAHIANKERTLKPLKLDQGLRYTCKDITEFEDSCGRMVRLAKGTEYRITGTRDGNGYVITFDDSDPLNGTCYLTAEVGCKLC